MTVKLKHGERFYQYDNWFIQDGHPLARARRQPARRPLIDGDCSAGLDQCTVDSKMPAQALPQKNPLLRRIDAPHTVSRAAGGRLGDHAVPPVSAEFRFPFRSS